MSEKDETKNVSVIEERKEEFALYTPDEEEKAIVSSVFEKFRSSSNERNKKYAYFDGLGLIDYIDDSVRRFITNVDERDDMEDWQARIHDPFTRNKVLAILGKIVQVLPIAQFSGRGDEDSRKAMILNNLYEYAEEVDDYEELMINILLESIVKGTAIGFEGVDRTTKKVRNVKGAGDNITISETSEITTKLFGAVVKLEDFYPSSVSIRTIKKMPYCFWRDTIPFQQFRQDWASFDRTSLVQPFSKNTYADEARPFYYNFISENTPEGEVEIIRYYNRDVDEYVVIANGVWLNPLTEKEKKVICPMPYNHKELPFYDIKFDFFGSDFFYGKSLPDRLKSLQDVLNVLTNMLLDQSFLTIFPPMLTNGMDSIEDDYLRPGRRTPIDTQGMPISQAFMKLDLGTPSGWHQYILEYTRKVMEQSSIDQVSQGVAGVGGRTTAQEIRVAAEGVASMLGLFARLVNYGIKRKATLKAANILQFWTDKNSPMVSKVLGEGGNTEMNKVFNTFRIDNAVLTHGKRGAKVIEMYAEKKEMPTKSELKAKSMLSKLETGREIEIVAIEPSYLRDFLYDVKLVANPKSESSKDLEKAIQLEKARIYMSFFPNIVNVQELAAQTAEKLGDDPAKILKQDAFQTPEEIEKAAKTQQDSGVPTSPGGGTANNMVRGSMGGEMGANDLSALLG